MRTRQHHIRGFTLIELLVTVAIIAILVGAVVLNIEFRNVGKSMRNTALRTGMLMQLASDQAVYSRQQFGIRFHPESYEFYVLSADDKDERVWEMFEDEQLKFKTPPVLLEFQVDISGLPIVLEDLADELKDATEENPIKPHIIFLSNGEIMPDFRILINDLEGEYQYEVATGEILPVVVEQLAGS
ncbi:MAG: Tfp pilus assembly protein FimT/FimU [Granulosicoccus sp.]